MISKKVSIRFRSASKALSNDTQARGMYLVLNSQLLQKSFLQISNPIRIDSRVPICQVESGAKLKLGGNLHSSKILMLPCEMKYFLKGVRSKCFPTTSELAALVPQ